MNNVTKFAVSLIAFAASFSAFADHDHHHKHEHKEHAHAKKEHHDHKEHKHDEHREHGAHVHGIASLNLAIDGDALEIEFNSPAANIVGFEHAATDDGDIAKARAAESVLKSPSALFGFGGTTCNANKADVDFSSLLAEKEHKHDHKKHHDHADKSHKDHQEVHSEIEAHYQFNCEQGGNLDAVIVNLFSKFPNTEKINVQWVSGNGQGGATLTPENNSLSLK